MTRKRWLILSVAATWVVFTLAAASVVWGGEAPASAGKNPPKVGGEVEIANVPFDLNEVIRTVRKNRSLPEESPSKGFRAEARGERPFVSKGNAFSHKTPRFQAEVGEDGLRCFAQGNKEKPDFEILSVSFEQGGVPQTVFGKGRLEEHAPGLLKGEARGGITPYARNRGEEGIEIYWTIDEPIGPDASALRVRLAIRAAGEPREHPEGLVFPARREEGQVTLSNVTVVDAAGRLEKIRPSLATGREILFEVSREFLENARYPILIDPTVGPEFPVEPSPVYGPAAAWQLNPSVASNGTDYFVAWEDWRNSAITGSDIYGTRVASDGTVLDPLGIAVSMAADRQGYPSAASNGTDYFIAWRDERSGFDIYGARVASDGTVLDPTGIAVSTAASSQGSPSVASDGTDYFVAWDDWRSGADADIYGTRVRASDGALLDGPPDTGGIAVSTAANGQGYPSAASDGTDYFVAWYDERSGTDDDIYGARVRASDGLLLDGPPDTGGIAVSTAVGQQYDPSVASNGTDYFVAWWDGRGGSWDIYGARVRASDGALLDDPPDTGGIGISTEPDQQSHPSVASNGTDYFVAWADYQSVTDIYGARVTSDGTVLDPTPTDIAVSTAVDQQYDPYVASNGTDYFVVWNDNRNSATTGWDIYGARVASLGGAVLDPPGIAVSTAASFQEEPSVASNGTDYFVAWQDARSGGWDVYGARVASDGTVLDAAGIAVSTAANDQQYPSATSNGTDYFIAWQDLRSGADYDIYGARVRASDGLLLDGPPDTGGIAVSTAADDQGYPSVASNGTDYFVAWSDGRSGVDSDIYGARVASDGTVLDPLGIAVSTAADSQQYPSAASNGTDYFVTWEDLRNDVWGDIYGARVAQDGTVLDPSGIAVSTAVDWQQYSSVASNGTDYFMAWEDRRSGTDDIYGARVRASDGALLDGPPDTGGIAVSTAASFQEYPSVASNGTGYFVAWGDRRNGLLDIYGTRVTSAGAVLDAAGILIQQSPYDDFYPAVAHSACGKYLVTYYRFYDDPSFQSQRVMARTVGSCEPFFDYASHALTDCGNADGVVDSGETVDLSVTVQNSGGSDAFNVSGTLSTTTPGITITEGGASFPDVAADGFGASLTPFQFVVAPGVACWTSIYFTLDLTHEDGLGNPFSNATSFQVQVGQDVPPVMFLDEDFNACMAPPPGWTVILGGEVNDGWVPAGPDCPSACEEELFPTNYYMCDSNCLGWESIQDDELISPVVDTSAAAAVTLRFDNDYYNYAAPTSSDVNVRSANTKSNWVTLKDFSVGCKVWGDCAPAGTGSFVLDATAQCAGAADCQVQFHQESNYYDSWWWAVDNVVLEEPIGIVCNANCGCALNSDADGLANCADNCPAVANPAQTDTDGDGVGDACDACPGFDDGIDTDGDGVPDGCDVCPGFNDGIDTDGDGAPDGCDTCTDTDGDGFGNPGYPANTCAVDNCPNDPDNDIDGDGVCGDVDPCPAIPSAPSGCFPAGSIYPTDINCSGCVNGFDLITLGLSFGEFCGDPYYNADADLDASGAVDGADLDALVADFGSGCT